MYKYWDIHVFFRRSEGYSFGLIADESIVDEELLIEEAIRQGKFAEKGDEDYVDDVYEMSEGEFKSVYNY